MIEVTSRVRVSLLAFVAVVALSTSACAQNAVMNVAAARNESQAGGQTSKPTTGADDGGDVTPEEAALPGGDAGTSSETAPQAGGLPGLFAPPPAGTPQVADGTPPSAVGGTTPAPAPGGVVPGPGGPSFLPPNTQFAGSNAAFCSSLTGALGGLSTLFQQTSGSGSDPFALIRTLSTGMRKSAQDFNALVKPAPGNVKPAVKTVAVELDKIASAMERLDMSGMQGLSGGPLSKALSDVTAYMASDCKPKV